MSELTPEVTAQLWAPLEAVIPLGFLDAENGMAGTRAVRTLRSRGSSASGTKPPAAYGPNHTEVAGFIKGVAELSPIQWLRVLDRRKLVASVAREGAVEPAAVVRAILVALEGTRELDMYTRCRVFTAVGRAAFAGANGDSPLAHADRAALLTQADWRSFAEAAPEANVEAVTPLVNAGTALIDFFGGRSDDEAVATWHAVAALVQRQQLPPIKFAASYAPFASAIPVTSPRALGALASRYATAVGRLGPSQCALLARPWHIDDELSGVVSRAIADGSARAGEEAAALAAVVTVPMRLATSGGWAAVKTAAFGGRVIAVRTRLTPAQLEALWAPIEPAIPLASLTAPARPARLAQT
jgi:hypothetical protein